MLRENRNKTRNHLILNNVFCGQAAKEANYTDTKNYVKLYLRNIAVNFISSAIECRPSSVGTIFPLFPLR